MDKYQNKYRIPSARLQSWDYGWAGAYFITICTSQREHYFGEIEHDKMIFSHAGVIADIMWYEIPIHSKNVELGEFVVMPNHIHGILILTGDGDGNDNGIDNGNGNAEKSKTIGQQRFQNIGKNSVSSIIGSYKSAISKHAHRLGFNLKWQTRFYDHIIRNDDEYQRIVNYIKTNPDNWEKDKFFKTEG